MADEVGNAETVTEPFTGPASESSGPPPMDFLKAGQGQTKPDEPDDPKEAVTREGAVDIVVGALDLIHDRIADATGYGRGPNPDLTSEYAEWGWRLNHKELVLWKQIIRFMVKRLKFKDYDVIIAFVGLAIMYATKAVGFVQFRKGAGTGGVGLDQRAEVAASKVPAGAMSNMAGDVMIPA